MPIEFVQKHYYQILPGFTGPASMQYITDTSDPLPQPPTTPSKFAHWPLPTWFPRKALIVRAIVIYESQFYNVLTQSSLYPQATSDALFDLREYAYRFLNTLHQSIVRKENETMMWVDPGGLHFSTASPPGAENSDYGPLKIIMHKYSSEPLFDYDTKIMPYAIPLDRDSGDKLAVQISGSDTVNWVGLGISYLVPAPFQPQ